MTRKGVSRTAKKQAVGKTKQNGIRPARIFIYALALAALGGGGYLLYDRLRRKKTATSDDTVDTTPTARDVMVIPARKTATRIHVNDDFPLKKGSRGTRVIQLQQALRKNGATLNADGKLGAATLAALKAAGYGDSVDETIFNTITGMEPATLRIVFNPAELAKKLFSAASQRNEQDVLDVLRQLKTVSDYAAVNEYYKKQSLIAKTIVTHLLDYAFSDNAATEALLRDEFKRIGLQVNDAGIWSLQGIPLYKDLITIRPTVVIDARNNRIPVSRNTILGDEVKIQNGMTWFRSVDRTLLKVPTQDVKYSTT